MKKIIRAHKRKIYASDKDGNLQIASLPTQLLRPIGDATNVRIETTIYAKSSANARAQLMVYEGTKDDIRPSEALGGVQVGSTQVYNLVGVQNVQVAAPFNGLIDLTFGVKSNTPTADVLEWMDAEVNITAYFD
jgi:hypothetical protein